MRLRSFKISADDFITKQQQETPLKDLNPMFPGDYSKKKITGYSLFALTCISLPPTAASVGVQLVSKLTPKGSLMHKNVLTVY